MQYQYRWWYVTISVTLMVLLYGYFVHPVWLRVEKLRVEETQWQSQLATLQKQLSYQNPATTASKSVTQADYLTAVTHWTYFHDATIQSVTFSKTDKQQLHLVAQGNTQQLMSLLLNLTNGSQAVVVSDFSWQALTKDSQRLTLELRIFDIEKVTMQLLRSQAIDHLFCQSQENNIFYDQDPARRLTVSLDQMKMIGYLQQAQHYQALLLLPTQQVFTVTVGTIVGIEQGVVTAIHQNDMQIVLPSKKTLTLTM